jgi:putative transposase
MQMLFYIHFNAEKHGLCSDFSKYPFSSFQAFLSDKTTKLKKEEVLTWFGGKTDFIKFIMI